MNSCMRNIYWHFFTKTPFQLKSGLLFLLLVISGLVFRQNLSAQTNDTIVTESANHQIWIDIYPHYYVTEKLEYYGDAGFRTIIDERSWNRIYARPSLRYHFNKNWEEQDWDWDIMPQRIGEFPLLLTGSPQGQVPKMN